MKIFILTTIIAVFSPLLTFANKNLTVNNKQSINLLMEDLTVESPWLRKNLLPSKNTAGYLNIKNNTDKDITILGILDPNKIAAKVEMHKNATDRNGVIKMVRLDKVAIPANTMIKLSPTNQHIMLIALQKDLEKGEQIKLILKTTVGNKEVTFPVK